MSCRLSWKAGNENQHGIQKRSARCRLQDLAKTLLISLRRTMATELARREVSEYEASVMLEHAAPSNVITARYVMARPNWLKSAQQAIEEVLN